ncbi:acyl-CoA dehydrogenase family protein [Amycolatopsis jejuensis]|uniref:acyl-CoA dehydrogenase family protein n=1 Tax=Amycolatopsis jejuensis TaxID=330084 RepID=UPI0005241694|nr:acyl-CoA dehydrogenase family protein [Amycolatopsis jejuensis]
MSTVDPSVTELMTSVFADYRAAVPDPVPGDPELWRTLGELGLVRLTGSEQHGGSGAGWPEAAELLRAAATHGVRVPLAEHDLLACWLLEEAGLTPDNARRTICLLGDDGTAAGVPWVVQSERVALVFRRGGTWQVTDAAVPDLDVEPGTNLVGEPRDRVSADTGRFPGVAVPDALISRLLLRGALVRGVQVSAVLDRIVELCVTHASDRTQFGRPLSKFQAVQHLVVDAAAEAASARSATEAALADGTEFRIAVARSCAGHAASIVVRNAHQVHGAIGTTREHRLHESTTAALAWRSEFGSVRQWDELLTDRATQSGRRGLWPLVCS